MRGIRHTLPLAATTMCCAVSCSGQVANVDGNEGEPQTHSEAADASSSAFGGKPDDGDSADDGDGEDGPASEPPTRTGGMGGQAFVDLDLWCPVGDDWELLFGETVANLGGAPSTDMCPELPRLDIGTSYCVTTFETTQAIVHADTQSCCYLVDHIYCR